MLVQWPWGPQEAPELHSSTSVGTGVSEGVRSKDTGRIPLWQKALRSWWVVSWVGYELKDPRREWVGRPRFPDSGNHNWGSWGSGFLRTPCARILESVKGLWTRTGVRN